MREVAKSSVESSYSFNNSYADEIFYEKDIRPCVGHATRNPFTGRGGVQTLAGAGCKT